MAVFLQTCNSYLYNILYWLALSFPEASFFVRFGLAREPDRRRHRAAGRMIAGPSSCGGVVDGRTPAPFGLMYHKLSSCRKDVKEGFFHQVLSFPIVFGQSISTLVQLLAAFANQVQQQIQELATVPLVDTVLWLIIYFQVSKTTGVFSLALKLIVSRNQFLLQPWLPRTSWTRLFVDYLPWKPPRSVPYSVCSDSLAVFHSYCFPPLLRCLAGLRFLSLSSFCSAGRISTRVGIMSTQ